MEHIIASIVKEISDFMKDFGLITGFLLVVLESLIPMLPLSAFVMLNVISYGKILGIIVSWIGTVIGSILAFSIVRKFKGYYLRKTNKEIIRFSKRLNNISIPNIAIIFSIPFTPSFAINIGAGLSNISKNKYIISLIIGKLPMILFWALIGKNVIESIKEPIILVKIFIMILLTYIVSKILNKVLKLEELWIT